MTNKNNIYALPYKDSLDSLRLATRALVLLFTLDLDLVKDHDVKSKLLGKDYLSSDFASLNNSLNGIYAGLLDLKVIDMYNKKKTGLNQIPKLFVTSDYTNAEPIFKSNFTMLLDLVNTIGFNYMGKKEALELIINFALETCKVSPVIEARKPTNFDADSLAIYPGKKPVDCHTSGYVGDSQYDYYTSLFAQKEKRSLNEAFTGIGFVNSGDSNSEYCCNPERFGPYTSKASDIFDCNYKHHDWKDADEDDEDYDEDYDDEDFDDGEDDDEYDKTDEELADSCCSQYGFSSVSCLECDDYEYCKTKNSIKEDNNMKAEYKMVNGVLSPVTGQPVQISTYNLTPNINGVIPGGAVISAAQLENNNKGEKTMNTGLSNMFEGLGADKSGLFKLSMMGLAIKNNEGRYVVYDGTQMVDVMDMVIDAKDMIFRMPAAEVTVGDLIISHREPLFVTELLEDHTIRVLNPMSDKVEVIAPSKSLLGFGFYVKVVSLVDALSPKAGEEGEAAQAGMNSLLPLMMMSGNGDMKDMLPLLMMGGLTGGAQAGNLNSMLPLLMMSGEGKSKDMLPLLMMSGLNGQGAGANPLGNMLPFLMMKDGGNDDMFQMLAMSQMLGTSGMFGLNQNR